VFRSKAALFMSNASDPTTQNLAERAGVIRWHTDKETGKRTRIDPKDITYKFLIGYYDYQLSTSFTAMVQAHNFGEAEKMAEELYGGGQGIEDEAPYIEVLRIIKLHQHLNHQSRGRQLKRDEERARKGFTV
jgi:hypothetical protein